MIFPKATLALAVIPLLAVSGFVSQPTVKATRVPLSATVEKELVPPRSLDELTRELDGTQELYGEHVQKTYG
jgi:hypothetical protein